MQANKRFYPYFIRTITYNIHVIRKSYDYSRL